VSKDGSSADEPGISQEKTGLRSETSTDDEAKPDVENSPEEVTTEQDRVPEVKAETKTEARTSSRWPPNRTVWFPKPDRPISLGSGQKKALRTTAPGMALAPHWCSTGLMPSQGRRFQQMRAHKMREESTKKERDEHVNTI
jgi:hypothetical protein